MLAHVTNPKDRAVTVKVGRDALTIQSGQTVPVVAPGDVLGRLEETHGLKVASVERDAPPAPGSKKALALALAAKLPPRTPNAPTTAAADPTPATLDKGKKGKTKDAAASTDDKPAA